MEQLQGDKGRARPLETCARSQRAKARIVITGFRDPLAAADEAIYKRAPRDPNALQAIPVERCPNSRRLGVNGQSSAARTPPVVQPCGSGPQEDQLSAAFLGSLLIHAEGWRVRGGSARHPCR